jgi:hypothetical protein
VLARAAGQPQSLRLDEQMTIVRGDVNMAGHNRFAIVGEADRQMRRRPSTSGSRLRPWLMCTTTNKTPQKSGGNAATIEHSVSRLPADPPIAMISRFKLSSRGKMADPPNRRTSLLAARSSEVRAGPCCPRPNRRGRRVAARVK